jgi:hypothetical protein
MLSKGKITPEEAESLLRAIEKPDTETPTGSVKEKIPKFLKVQVISASDDNVDVRVPLSLIRAGIQLTNLIPPAAMERISESLEKHGMSVDLTNLKKEDIEALIDGLSEMVVNVESKDGDKVYVYCE